MSPLAYVDSVFDVDFFLLGQESVVCWIPHSEKTDELVVIGCAYYLLDFLSLVGHGYVEHTSQTLANLSGI